MKKLASLLTLSATAAGTAFAGVSATPNSQGLYEISDPIVGDVVLEASKQYLLTEIVYVGNPGNTGVPAVSGKITIPAGTTIFGRIGVPDGPDAGTVIDQEPGTLVISRAGQIEAVGTPSAPIIFTYEGDPAPRTAPTAPLVGDALLTGLWGGVIILGNSVCNNNQSATNSLLAAGTDFIEGLVEPTPGVPSAGTEDLRGVYGGQSIHDNSGVMRYVSIRNGGFVLGSANEINGLTLGGVGAGTTLEYIEVIAGQDDGFEWFGGTVNSKYLLSAYNNDDAFDYDQGFSGLGQFWCAVMASNGVDGDKGGEFDGDDQNGAKPYAVPLIYNMTVIGGNAPTIASGSATAGQIDYDASAGGGLFNSIIVQSAGTSLDINIGSGKLDMVTLGLLNIRNNIWYFDGATNNAARHGDGSLADTVLAGGGNTFANPFLGGASYTNLNTLKRYEANGVPLKPLAFGDVVTNLEPYTGTYFDAVSYKGAFDPSVTAWTAGWTVPSQLGYFIE
jgi:hypothetical protein